MPAIQWPIVWRLRVSPPDNPGNASAMDHRDPVRIGQKVVQLFRDPDDAGARGRLFEQRTINRLCRQHIEPHCRIASNDEAMRVGKLARNDELLQIAAGQRGSGEGRVRRPHVEATYQIVWLAR